MDGVFSSRKILKNLMLWLLRRDFARKSSGGLSRKRSDGVGEKIPGFFLEGKFTPS